MFTSHEITNTFVVDHQQRLLGEARQHHVARTARHMRRTPALADVGQRAGRVLLLPASTPQASPAEERVAS